MVALIPLLFADMKRDWSATAHASDASFVGCGVVVAKADSDAVARAGRQRNDSAPAIRSFVHLGETVRG